MVFKRIAARKGLGRCTGTASSDLPDQSGKRFAHGISDDTVNRMMHLALNSNKFEIGERFYPR